MNRKQNKWRLLFRQAKPVRFLMLPILTFSMVSAIHRSGLAVLTQRVLDAALLGDDMWLWGWLLAGLLLMGVTNLATYGRVLLGRVAAERISLSMRVHYFGRFLRLPLLAGESFDFGQRITRLTDDIEQCAQFVPFSVRDIMFGFAQTTLAFWFGFSVSWKLTLVALTSTLISIVFSRVIAPRLTVIQASIQSQEDAVRQFMQDRLKNRLVTLSYNLTSWHHGAFVKLYKARIREVLRFERLQTLLSSLGSFFGSLSTILVMIFGVYWIGRQELTVGAVIGFLEISSALYWPFTSLPSLLATIAKQRVSMERLCQWEEVDEETLPSEGKTDLTHIRLVGEGIRFAYPGAPSPVLQDFCINASSGEIVGLKGASGGGKSTLLKVLASLYLPNAGEVYLEGPQGERVRGVNTRPYITYVPQEPEITEKTIRELIAEGKPGASHEAVERAARKAHAHVFINAELNGYETTLTEGGRNFSYGQLQRLSIARALLKDAPVLLLDEPSAALDAASEEWILTTLRDISADKIIVLSTHSENMRALCTRIYEIPPS